MKASKSRLKVKFLLLFSVFAMFFMTGCDSDKGKGFKIKSFNAEVEKCSRTVNLSWELKNSGKISGIDVYRKASGSNDALKLNASTLPSDTQIFTDIPPADVSTCSYYISCIIPEKEAVKSEDKTVSLLNTGLRVENLSIIWDLGKPKLSWSAADGLKFRVSRSVDSASFQSLVETDSKEFADTLPDSFLAVKYRVVVLLSGKDQKTGETYECEGAPAEFEIAGRSYSSVSVQGAAQGRTGRFLIKPGGFPPFSLTGTCLELGQDFMVMAIDHAGRPINGNSLADGAFSLSLDAAGDWEIVASSRDGKIICRFFVTIAEDGVPPELSVSGEGSVTESSSGVYTVTGSVSDSEFPLSSIEIKSDLFPGRNFACAAGQAGNFACQVPLGYGVNTITVIATDPLGNKIEKIIKVNWPSPDLPVITIESPAEGSSVYSEKIQVKGSVRSSLPKNQITLTVADTPVSLTDGSGTYSFSVDGISLVEGPNVIVVKASTSSGDVYARCHVTRFVTPPDDRDSLPVISISTPTDGAFISDPRLQVKGSVKCLAGISSVTVNGAAATLSGSPFEMAFSSEINPGESSSGTYAIKVVATSSAGKSSEITISVRPDFTAPVINIDQAELLSFPAENRVRQNPYLVSGYITEKNLKSFSINQTPVSVTPDASVSGKWRFSYSLDLVRDRTTQITLVATDYAGHTTTKQYILRLDTSFGYVIEILSPQPGSTINAATDPFNLSIAVRISGLSPDHVVSVLLDGNPVAGPGMSGEMFTATVPVSGADAEHSLNVKVKDRNGSVVAERSASFKVVKTPNGEDGPKIKVIRQEPADNSSGVEPNAFISLYFDKPIDQTKLQIVLKETVHGQVYDETSGGDISSMSSVNLKDVNRDQENVPGGMSFFPEKIMTAFYPSRYFGYGASVYVSVSYNGQEIYKSSFKVRSLPTLVQGIVTDQFSRPLEGIEITLPDQGKKAVTDSNGAYGFGFGDDPDKALPAGRLKTLVNPGMKNVKYGICEQLVTVVEGRLNQAASVRLPVINTADPYYFVKSGDNPASFSGGDLVLDLSGAGLLFPDGRSEGNVHVDMLDISAVNYSSVTVMPNWMYCLQPMGINVSGAAGITIKAPAAYGSYEYLDGAGNLVLMMGYDPDLGKLVPVGAGIVDKAAKTVTSVGRLPLKRLDYIGYVLADAKLQGLLEKFMNNEISLDGIVTGLGK